MIELKGKIENRGSVKILIIHSKKLSEKVNQIKNRVNIKNFGNGLILTPKGDIHVTIAANKRLQIAITTLIKKEKIKISNQNNIPLYLKEEDWKITENEILAKSIGNPLSKIIPYNLIKKNAALCKKGKKYYIDISSKAFHDICRKNIIKCLLNRIKDSIIIIKSEKIRARRLTPHSKKRVQIAIPKEIIRENEIKKLDKIGWLPIILKLNIESFGLKISDFYGNKEEKELVIYLSKQNIKIKVKEPSDSYDMLLPESKTGIEVHNSDPRYGDLVTRHKIKPGMVRLRILEAEFLTKNKDLKKFFVVLNKKWKNGKYIQELINKTNRNVKVLFTNFKDKWYERIGKEIIKDIV